MLRLFIRLVILAAIVVAVVLIVRSCSSSSGTKKVAMEPADGTAPILSEPADEEPGEPRALVYLDAGHGDYDGGAVSQDGVYKEKDITLAIAQYTRDILENEMDCEVVMTRDDDSGFTLEERVEMANDSGADLFISIHINALEDDDEWTGIYTFYYRDEDKTLGEDIQNGIITATNGEDRGVRRGNYYVIVYTEMPAVLIEGGFITTPADLENLTDSQYQMDFARGIANGVRLYLSRDGETQQEPADETD